MTTSSNPISTSNFQVPEATYKPGQSAEHESQGKVLCERLIWKQQPLILFKTSTILSRATNLVGAGIGLTEYFRRRHLRNTGVLQSLYRIHKDIHWSHISCPNTTSVLLLRSILRLITPSSGVYLPQQKFILDQSQNAVVHFTTNGVTPTDSDLWFYNNQSFWMSVRTAVFCSDHNQNNDDKSNSKGTIFQR